MGVSAVIATVAQAAIKPLADAYGKRVDRRMAKDSLKAKATLAQHDSAAKQDLSDAEWEVVMASQMGGTWKDEYALIVGTLPYLMIFFSAVWYGLTGKYEMMQGTMAGIQALAAVGVNVGFIITAVVLAASGLSVWRWLRR